MGSKGMAGRRASKWAGQQQGSAQYRWMSRQVIGQSDKRVNAEKGRSPTGG